MTLHVLYFCKNTEWLIVAGPEGIIFWFKYDFKIVDFQYFFKKYLSEKLLLCKLTGKLEIKQNFIFQLRHDSAICISFECFPYNPLLHYRVT